MRRFDSAACVLLLALSTFAVPARAGFRNVYDRQVQSSYSVIEVVERPAGGYAIAAGRPMYLLQTNASGALISTTTYDADAAASLDVTSDGGFVLAGEKLFYDDYLVAKTDAAGTVEWSQVYSQGTGDQGLYSIREVPAGGYITSGIFTIRLDAAGAQQWSKIHIGGGGNVNSIRVTSDGGFVGTGEGSYGNPADNYNFVVTRMAPDGAVLWNRAFGGAEYDWGASCEQTSDDGFIATGWTVSFGAGGSDGFLVRLDPFGAVLWGFTYGTAGDDSLYAVKQTSDGGYVAAGRFDGRPGIMRVDSDGALAWAQAYPVSAGSSGGQLYSLIESSAGTFVAAGKDESNRALLIEVDGAGVSGGCFEMDPGVSVAPAPFSISDNTTNFAGSFTSPPQVTTASSGTTNIVPCVPTTNQPPTCDAGADQPLDCDGLDLSGEASDPDGDTVTPHWTASCAGVTFTPSADVLNPSVTFTAGCTGSCTLTLSVNDGNGGTATNSLVVDCTALDGLDCDRDGAINSVDCAPADPTAFAIPGEVPLLYISKGVGDTSILKWDDVAAAAGTGTHYDVVGGQIAHLWIDGDFTRAACVTQDVADITSVDARPLPPHASGFPGDGWYYLVRAQNACGASDYGAGTPGPRVIDPSLCD